MTARWLMKHTKDLNVLFVVRFFDNSPRSKLVYRGLSE